MLALLTIALLVALFGIVKPFKGFERKHFGMAAAALFVACLIAVPSPEGRNAVADELTPVSGPKQGNSPAIENSPTAEKSPAIEEAAGEEGLTGPQKNASRSAEQYLAMTGFSKEGLIQQLSSDAGDGYSVEDATAAVESLSVDWDENAAKSARQYLDMSGFSCKGLIEQLSSSAGDKYTVAQATYGARQAGAC